MTTYDHNILGVGNNEHPANEQPNNEPLTYDEIMDEIRAKCSDDCFESVCSMISDYRAEITNRDEIIKRLQTKIQGK